ncbi:MAG: nitroreductase family protein [Bacteroidales bacterium]|nr:nitroreductase family protein [Bacteroidales bacterium]MCF8458459.1 nitroreductase family protein [Bacteroidales bacterium]
MESPSLLNLIRNRQSDRSYLSKPVEKEKIELCLEASRLAPSACNSQPWHFVVVDDPKLSKDIAKATFSDLVSFNKFALTAPVFLVIVMEKPKNITQVGGIIKKREYPLYDIGIAAIQFCLQAEELGLGTCMMGWFNEKKIQSLLSVPPQKRIGLVISLGYPSSEKKREKVRKDRSEVISYNSYK